MKSLIFIAVFFFGFVSCSAFLGDSSSESVMFWFIIWNIWLAALAVTGRIEEIKQ